MRIADSHPEHDPEEHTAHWHQSAKKTFAGGLEREEGGVWTRGAISYNSIAHQQGTSKREGAQSINQSGSHEVNEEPPTPVQTSK